MEEYYKALGLTPDASDEKVKEQYEKLLRIYDGSKFAEPSQKRHAEKSRKEVTEAYNKIMSKNKTSSQTSAKSGTYTQGSRTGTYSYSRSNSAQATASATAGAYAQQTMYGKEESTITRQEFYNKVRRMIQQKSYNSAITRLSANPFFNDAEWNFLMGSAKYFAGYISDSYNYFADAARLDPDKAEYVATFNRMNQSRNGNVYNSPYQNEKKKDIMTFLENNKGIIGRLICLGCLCSD